MSLRISYFLYFDCLVKAYDVLQKMKYSKIKILYLFMALNQQLFN